MQVGIVRRSGAEVLKLDFIGQLLHTSSVQGE